MRLLVIGYPLPNPEIDNYNVLTAPSYYDYDCVFVDPASITQVVHQVIHEGAEFSAFDGRPVANGPSTAAHAGIADQLRRRLEETQRMLESGGTVIVMGRPNATVAGVVGFEGADRYSWLPAPAGVAWAPPFLRAAEGKTLRITDDQHPTATLLRQFRSEIGYRAVFDDRQPTLRANGKVFATGGTGVPIGVEFAVSGGRVVFVPALGDTLGTIRSEIADQVAAAAKQFVGTEASQEPPWWSKNMELPGLAELDAEMEEAAKAADEAGSRLDAVREQHAELASHRRLLYGEGVGFRRAVEDAFLLLGFTFASEAGEPLAIESDGQVTLVEVESAQNEVVEWPYIRLQRRLEEKLLKEGVRQPGMVVVNGFRSQTPDERKEQYTSALRIACENYRYGLMTGMDLFELVRIALEGADDATLTAIRRRLTAATGRVTAEVAQGVTQESRETGPIF